MIPTEGDGDDDSMRIRTELDRLIAPLSPIPNTNTSAGHCVDGSGSGFGNGNGNGNGGHPQFHYDSINTSTCAAHVDVDAHAHVDAHVDAHADVHADVHAHVSTANINNRIMKSPNQNNDVMAAHSDFHADDASSLFGSTSILQAPPVGVAAQEKHQMQQQISAAVVPVASTQHQDMDTGTDTDTGIYSNYNHLNLSQTDESQPFMNHNPLNASNHQSTNLSNIQSGQQNLHQQQNLRQLQYYQHQYHQHQHHQRQYHQHQPQQMMLHQQMQIQPHQQQQSMQSMQQLSPKYQQDDQQHFAATAFRNQHNHNHNHNHFDNTTSPNSNSNRPTTINHQPTYKINNTHQNNANAHANYTQNLHPANFNQNYHHHNQNDNLMMLTKDQSTQTMTLLKRIQMESSNNYHFFSLIEDYNLNLIHVQKSFAPALPTLIALVIRLYWLAISISFTYHDFFIETDQNGHDAILYFSQLTNITMMVTILYQLTSCFLTFVAATHSCTGRTKHWYVLYQPPPLASTLHPSSSSSSSSSYSNFSSVASSMHDDNTTIDNDDNGNGNGNTFVTKVQTQNNIPASSSLPSLSSATTSPKFLVCFNWLLYTIVQPTEFVIAFGYWVYEYNPNKDSLEYTDIYKHGIIAILLLIDGNIIGRIPLRVKHIVTPYIYGSLYMIYTIYFSYSELGSHHNHGFIYSNLNWESDLLEACQMAFILIYVASPLFFVICYFISLSSWSCNGRSTVNCCNNRRYRDNYCCWFNCLHCLCSMTCSFCNVSFQGERRILAGTDHEEDRDDGDGDGDAQVKTGTKVIVSRPWTRRRRSKQKKSMNRQDYNELSMHGVDTIVTSF